MSYTNGFDISAAGMSLERLRLDVSAMNLANVHTSSANASDVYRPLRVVASNQAGTAGTNFDQMLRSLSVGSAQGNGGVDIVADTVAPKKVYDPGHPQADELGFVFMPNVDPVNEMLTIITATRAYEANVRAFNASKTMALSALDIGQR